MTKGEVIFQGSVNRLKLLTYDTPRTKITPAGISYFSTGMEVVDKRNMAINREQISEPAFVLVSAVYKRLLRVEMWNLDSSPHAVLQRVSELMTGVTTLLGLFDLGDGNPEFLDPKARTHQIVELQDIFRGFVHGN